MGAASCRRRLVPEELSLPIVEPGPSRIAHFADAATAALLADDFMADIVIAPDSPRIDVEVEHQANEASSQLNRRDALALDCSIDKEAESAGSGTSSTKNSPSSIIPPPQLLCEDDYDSDDDDDDGAACPAGDPSWSSCASSSTCPVVSIDSSVLSAGLIPYQPPARVPRGRHKPLSYGPALQQQMEERNSIQIAKSVEELIHALTTTPTQAQQVALRGVKFVHHQLLEIASGIEANMGIRRLMMEHCGLEQDGMETIAQSLEKNQSLTAVSLAGNSYYNLVPFAKLLTKNDTLTTLNLGSNRYSATIHGFEEVIAALESNSTLKVLDLDGTSCSKTSKERIRGCLKRNKSPTYVVALHTSPDCCASSNTLSLTFTDMTGTEVACLPETDPGTIIRLLRRNLAQMLGCPWSKLAVTLPDGNLLTKENEEEPLHRLLFDVGDDFN